MDFFGGDSNLILFFEWFLGEQRAGAWVVGKTMGVTVIFL